MSGWTTIRKIAQYPAECSQCGRPIQVGSTMDIFAAFENIRTHAYCTEKMEAQLDDIADTKAVLAAKPDELDLDRRWFDKRDEQRRRS